MSAGATVERGPAALARGLASERTAVLFVALAFVGVSTPQALNFFRILPVLGVLVLAGLHLAASAGLRPGRVRLPAVALVLVGWLGLSVLWSDNRTMTLVQTCATCLVVLLAAMLGTACRLPTLVRGVALGGLLVLALSIAVAVVSPSTGLMPAGYQAGALRGLYVHRNLLAEALAPAYLAALAVPFKRRGSVKRIALVGALFGGIVLTRSSTALAAVTAATAVGVLVWVIQRAPRRHRHLPLAAAVGAVLLGGAVVVANPANVLALLGRDSTLTGRALIWEIVRRLIGERPLLGFGWGATWDPTDRIRRTVSTLAKFEVQSAHNGYLDVWLQAGLIGLVAFLLLLAVVLIRGSAFVLHADGAEARWAPVLVAGLLVYNVGEANLDAPLMILLLVVTATALLVSRARQSGDRVAAPALRRIPRTTIVQPTEAPAV